MRGAAARRLPKPELLELSGEPLEEYIAAFCRLAPRGRLNQYFPEAPALARLFDFFRPGSCHGLYDRLLIDKETGLPVESEYGRIWSDRDLASKILAEATTDELERAASELPTAVNLRRLARARYMAELSTAALPPASRLDLRLKWVDEKARVAHFITVYDRYDLSDNLFVRYAIHLRQRDSRWSRQQVELRGDDLQCTDNFRNAIAKFSADESEFAFILINDLRNIAVDEVSRGRVGPFWFKGMNAPPGLDAILGGKEGAYILSFPLDRTALSIRADWNNDPFSRLYRDCLDEGARSLVERKAKDAGYHVMKDRKFACTANVETELRGWLAARGVKSIVYAV